MSEEYKYRATVYTNYTITPYNEVATIMSIILIWLCNSDIRNYCIVIPFNVQEK